MAQRRKFGDMRAEFSHPRWVKLPVAFGQRHLRLNARQRSPAGHDGKIHRVIRLRDFAFLRVRIDDGHSTCAILSKGEQ